MSCDTRRAFGSTNEGSVVVKRLGFVSLSLSLSLDLTARAIFLVVCGGALSLIVFANVGCH